MWAPCKTACINNCNCHNSFSFFCHYSNSKKVKFPNIVIFNDFSIWSLKSKLIIPSTFVKDIINMEHNIETIVIIKESFSNFPENEWHLLNKLISFIFDWSSWGNFVQKVILHDVYFPISAFFKNLKKLTQCYLYNYYISILQFH